MKKLILSVTLASITILSNAQIIKTNVLSTDKEGDELEKATYTNIKDPIQKDTWCAAFMKRPAEGSSSPTIGKELSYPKYAEGGPSVNLGFPSGIKGYRNSAYSLTESGKTYKKGVYYLACLINLSKVGTNKPTELIALNATHTGSSARAQGFVNKSEDGKLKITAVAGKQRMEIPNTFDFGKTHLIILKADYPNTKYSLFVDPDLGKSEPKANAEIMAPETLTVGVKAFSFKNGHIYKGNIGNFRFTNKWEDIIAQ